jgi:hypothetical protein
MSDQNTTPGSADDFFDGVGGSGAPSFKFGGTNTGIKGKVVDQYRTFVTEPGSREPKTYADGTPIPQLNVTLQTDLRNWDKVAKVPVDPETQQPRPASEDTGLRRIFVKYDMRRAIGAALQAVGEKALATDGELAVKQTGEKDTKKANGLPLYEARYKAPEKAENADLWDTGSDAPDESAGASASAPVADDDEPPF